MLLWQRSSNLSNLFFVAILLLLSIEPTTPVPPRVASQWRATLSCILLECVTACLFLISVEFRVLMPTATGSERVLSPGTDVVLEVNRVAANEQYPLYPGSKATDSRPYASSDAMWRAFSD